ncbi:MULTISPECIES: exodeoxyribonuclease VII small subunit [Alteromonadaceae]|uniref:exodeoxyribonuclease VII small subunit n=1 Tax=Alteromonadaceae TaxID=72275 RepID=UPI001C083BC2|nr:MULTISPECIES: exodeoxyribonuclease VII small subunit [Aliiglaciecola]MBU2879781.1 exodeoxyribonuclease VII small subunit [Aliiglaciecola lipolytica]MDO6709940.1 exodeoxyribonuclease VII small subunit [Aliiglaciecola sp. 2_MG-2023]MDO6751088.1 exodeoxyribonuclease VII small subunit [Aliiglaciecola sp. 1_MG-2023]
MSKDNELSDNSFEDTMQELEQLVAEMEQGDIPLEQALAKFERGISLARNSQKMLKAAEQRVQILMQQDQEDVLQELDQQRIDE